MRPGLAICILLVLGFGCGKRESKVTRDQCSAVADHIADLITNHLGEHPDELWESVTKEPGSSGLPPEVTKESLGTFIATPEGKTWMLTVKGHVRTGTERGIDNCVASGKAKTVKCLLAAKSKADVTACDAIK